MMVLGFLALLGQDAAPAAGQTSVTLALEIFTRDLEPASPISLRLVARNSGRKAVACPYRDNRDFATARFRMAFRQGESVVAERIVERYRMGRRVGGYMLAPGAELRFEALVMPGRLAADSFTPLPPGDYELLVTVEWQDRLVTAPLTPVRVSAVSPRATDELIDRQLVEYVEHFPRNAPPPSAAAVLNAEPGGALGLQLRRLALWDRWRRLGERTDLSAEELRRAYDELKRDVTAHMSDQRFARVAYFSGELLYATAALAIAQVELAVLGKDLEREAMDAETRMKWRSALRDAAAAVQRLGKDCPESSFNEDAQKLLTRQMQAVRNTLEKHPTSPNAAELRDALSILEGAVRRDSP